MIKWFYQLELATMYSCFTVEFRGKIVAIMALIPLLELH